MFKWWIYAAAALVICMAFLSSTVEAGPAVPHSKFARVVILVNSPQGKKEFFINRDVQSSWYRALGQCGMYDGMRLATFDSPNQYKEFIYGIRTAGVTGDFWIGASKLGDTKFNFIPDFLPVSKVHTETIDGDGDCVFLRVDSQFKVKWAAGECGYTNEKYIICETNP